MVGSKGEREGERNDGRKELKEDGHDRKQGRE